MGFRSIAVMGFVLAALGVLFVLTNRPTPEPEAATRPSLWSAHMDDLRSLAIALPRQGEDAAWVKRDDREWYFDRPNGPKVDAQRWGGGIPLLLSGPNAERLIVAGATGEQLKAYGFETPNMSVDLILENGQRVAVEVGDRTPSGSAYYIRLVSSTDVYSIHEAWVEVLSRLVLDPPYPRPGAT